jgi:hypothetical protein
VDGGTSITLTSLPDDSVFIHSSIMQHVGWISTLRFFCHHTQEKSTSDKASPSCQITELKFAIEMARAKQTTMSLLFQNDNSSARRKPGSSHGIVVKPQRGLHRFQIKRSKVGNIPRQAIAPCDSTSRQDAVRDFSEAATIGAVQTKKIEVNLLIKSKRIVLGSSGLSLTPSFGCPS